MFKRIVLIVLDGVGIGAAPDAASFGDADAATLPHVAQCAGGLQMPQLQCWGLGNLIPLAGVPSVERPQAGIGVAQPASAGKDSIFGHWELAGRIESQPFATFPAGFPPRIIQVFSSLAACEPLGNLAASGTDVLRRFGVEHLQTGRPIVYTSSDSVFQVAAHEDLLPPERLYALCRQLQQQLLPYRICRVIARPFVGDDESSFRRTCRRHDFTLPASAPTLLDDLHQAGVPTCGIGKIRDVFAGRGVATSFSTEDNAQGMALLGQCLGQQKEGLIFVNLVDFDMLYGHRLDVAGFAAALEDFDRRLTSLLPLLSEDDLLLVTADHGCDPTTAGTDHCRENVPILAWSPGISSGVDLGCRRSYADVGASIAENFAVSRRDGESFLSRLSLALTHISA